MKTFFPHLFANVVNGQESKDKSKPEWLNALISGSINDFVVDLVKDSMHILQQIKKEIDNEKISKEKILEDLKTNLKGFFL